ncbi:hypothetical protein Dimus_022428, partial [Dionaea muscipula]
AISLPAGVAVKRRIEEIRPKLGSTKRINRVLGQPLIGTLQVKAMVATRDQTDRLLGPYYFTRLIYISKLWQIGIYLEALYL